MALRNLVEHLASSKSSEKSHCFKRLVFPQVPLSNYFEGIFSKSLGGETFQWSGEVNATSSSSQVQNGASQFAPIWGHTASSTSFFSSSSIISETKDFLEAVEKLNDSGSITNDEKLQIHALIDILREVNDPHSASAYGSLDEPGRRYSYNCFNSCGHCTSRLIVLHPRDCFFLHSRQLIYLIFHIILDFKIDLLLMLIKKSHCWKFVLMTLTCI